MSEVYALDQWVDMNDMNILREQLKAHTISYFDPSTETTEDFVREVFILIRQWQERHD